MVTMAFPKAWGMAILSRGGIISWPSLNPIYNNEQRPSTARIFSSCWQRAYKEMHALSWNVLYQRLPSFLCAYEVYVPMSVSLLLFPIFFHWERTDIRLKEAIPMTSLLILSLTQIFWQHEFSQTYQYTSFWILTPIPQIQNWNQLMKLNNWALC